MPSVWVHFTRFNNGITLHMLPEGTLPVVLAQKQTYKVSIVPEVDD
jgi:hypothetical protein